MEVKIVLIEFWGITYYVAIVNDAVLELYHVERAKTARLRFYCWGLMLDHEIFYSV